MSIPIPIAKENAEEKARRVRLLRIWTDICAMALCEMPEGRSKNNVFVRMDSCNHDTWFTVSVNGKDGNLMSMAVSSTSEHAEEKLADIQRRLKPYVA